MLQPLSQGCGVPRLSIPSGVPTKRSEREDEASPHFTGTLLARPTPRVFPGGPAVGAQPAVGTLSTRTMALARATAGPPGRGPGRD